MPDVTKPGASLRAIALLGGALLAAAPAFAQQPPTTPRSPPRPAPAARAQSTAPAPGATQEPERTTASYGDWVVRCETVAGPPPSKSCDMEQLAQMQGQTSPISRVAIPLPSKGQTARLFIQVPVNVSLAAPVRILADNKGHMSVPFRRCVPAGCFAEVEIKDDEIKRLRAETAAGKLQYKDSGERDVSIPLSFKGFGQAFDALMKQ